MEAIGCKINYVSNIIKREIEKLESIEALERVSGTNSFILVYILEKEIVFQKDIEKEFGITRSTASKVISLMESKGLIIRKSVSNDLRLKQLVLTDEAKKIVLAVKEDLNKFEKRLTYGLTEEEKELLSSILGKIEKNIFEGGKNNAS
ncbi:MAG: MarR family transcriptional regulator [Acholeplasmatales bacterium]|jgi:DNA-binding MarR family transcriptional regulator|nr:MarR family transcriptional regulator [Acholeplasmatales bacterium]